MKFQNLNYATLSKERDSEATANVRDFVYSFISAFAVNRCQDQNFRFSNNKQIAEIELSMLMKIPVFLIDPNASASRDRNVLCKLNPNLLYDTDEFFNSLIISDSYSDQILNPINFYNNLKNAFKKENQLLSESQVIATLMPNELTSYNDLDQVVNFKYDINNRQSYLLYLTLSEVDNIEMYYSGKDALIITVH